MVLEKLKSNHTLNFFLFPVLGILFWLRNLISPVKYPAFPGEFDNMLFSPVYGILENSPFLSTLTALLLILVMGAILLQLNSRYDFIRIRTMIPGTLFIIMSGGFTNLQTMHPVYFGALFFLIALYRLFSACERSMPYSAAFDSGFFLGVAFLFYVNIIVVLPAFFVGIGILSRESGWREYFLNLIGFILPLAFGVSFAFYTDNIPAWMELIEVSVLTPNDFTGNSIFLIIYTGILLLFTLLASIKMLRDYDTKKVSTRKYFIIFFLVFICAVAGIIFIPAVSMEMLIIALIPVTFLVTNFFMFLKSRFWSEFLFLFLLITVVALQIIS